MVNTMGRHEGSLGPGVRIVVIPAACVTVNLFCIREAKMYPMSRQTARYVGSRVRASYTTACLATLFNVTDSTNRYHCLYRERSFTVFVV